MSAGKTNRIIIFAVIKQSRFSQKQNAFTKNKK